ncbi:MAG: DUF2142 domain-containing protein [Homoserinimonas sp.]
MRKLKAIYFAPALAVIALIAWALASPIGAAPDDDFHLVSTWCATDSAYCKPGESSATRVVPEALVHPHCYAQDALQSAACQDNISWTEAPSVETKRGNFVGAYPPVYYAVMNVFAGEDLLSSALLMRLVNVLLFVGLTTALFVLLPAVRRPTLIWTWLVTTLPMGVFILSSNNPSSWAVMGLGTGWLALLGYLETSGRPKWLLGAVFAVATLMAAGSRGDAAMYAILGIAAVFVLTVPWSKAERTAAAWKRYGLDAILPAVMTIVCAVLFLSSRQTQSGIGGFGGDTSVSGAAVGVGNAEAALSGFSLLAYNLLNIPFLWAGNFGEWGLGWLDTPMPSIVPFAAVAALVAIGFSGLGRLWGRKLVVTIGVGLVLWLLPVYVLQQGGDTLGEAVQPRYILPLLVLFVGLVLLGRAGQMLRFSRPQLALVSGALILVNFIALHFNMRRYLTGIGVQGGNLDAGYEWWWDLAISPASVWIIGSIAYAALVIVLTYQVGWLGRGPSTELSKSERSQQKQLAD